METAEKGSIPHETRIAIASAVNGRANDERYGVFTSLLTSWVARTATAAARKPETAGYANALASAGELISHSIRETNALNLDRRLTMLQVFDLIDNAA
jgi:hypothetical protein